MQIMPVVLFLEKSLKLCSFCQIMLKNYAGTIDSSLAFSTGGKFDQLHCGSFLHESNRAALLFLPLPPSLHVMPLSQKVFLFLLFHYEIFKSFRLFLYHCTLFLIPMKATSHLPSSSGRNFGTISLNRENSQVGY